MVVVIHGCVRSWQFPVSCALADNKQRLPIYSEIYPGSALKLTSSRTVCPPMLFITRSKRTSHSVDMLDPAVCDTPKNGPPKHHNRTQDIEPLCSNSCVQHRPHNDHCRQDQKVQCNKRLCSILQVFHLT